MGFIKRAQKFSIFLLIFSLNFESIDLFYLGISYLATKISISLLLFFSLLNFKESFTFKVYPKYIKVVSFYFFILTVNNFINRGDGYNNIIDIPFFLNLLVFIILCNYTMVDKKILLKGLVVLSLSSFFLAMLYFSGFAVEGEGELEGRSSIFGMNQNHLGVTLCISIFVLLSVVFENKLELNKNRSLFLIPIPFLLVFMLGTGSRVAFISLVLGVFSLLFLNRSLNTTKKYLIATISLFFLLMLWAVFLKNTLVVGRLFDSISEGDLSSRDLIWLSIYDVIVNNAIIGIGETGYGAKMMAWADNVPSPHNVFIEVICYTGLVGLIVFIVFLKRIYYKAKEMNVKGKELLPIILLIPFFGNLLSGQLFDMKQYWVLLAFIASDSYNENNVDDIKIVYNE